jgi:hypothetical protein
LFFPLIVVLTRDRNDRTGERRYRWIIWPTFGHALQRLEIAMIEAIVLSCSFVGWDDCSYDGAFWIKVIAVTGLQELSSVG